MAEKSEKEEGRKKAGATEKPLDKMTVKELREIAKELPDVTGVHAMKKDELLRIIKADRGIKDEEPVKQKKKKGKKKEVTVKDLKKVWVCGRQLNITRLEKTATPVRSEVPDEPRKKKHKKKGAKPSKRTKARKLKKERGRTGSPP